MYDCSYSLNHSRASSTSTPDFKTSRAFKSSALLPRITRSAHKRQPCYQDSKATENRCFKMPRSGNINLEEGKFIKVYYPTHVLQPSIESKNTLPPLYGFNEKSKTPNSNEASLSSNAVSPRSPLIFFSPIYIPLDRFFSLSSNSDTASSKAESSDLSLPENEVLDLNNIDNTRSEIDGFTENIDESECALQETNASLREELAKHLPNNIDSFDPSTIDDSMFRALK